MPKKTYSPITYRPMRDLIWTRTKASTLQWELCPVGGSVLACGSEANVKEMIFRSAASRCLDWTWALTRRPDLGERAWLCRRVS